MIFSFQRLSQSPLIVGFVFVAESAHDPQQWRGSIVPVRFHWSTCHRAVSQMTMKCDVYIRKGLYANVVSQTVRCSITVLLSRSFTNKVLAQLGLLSHWKETTVCRNVSLFFFIVMHVVANLHVFNGYGYFYVRLYCTCLGFQANIVEQYVLLSVSQHIFVGLKRTRDQKSTRRLQGVRLFLCTLVLYRPWIPGEHRRGICAVECVTAHLRGFEEVSRSEVVFWINEWSIESGYTCLMLLTFMPIHLSSSASQIMSTLMSMHFCTVQALDSRRTSSRNMCR